MYKVAAIIVTYNAERNNWIRKCLDSLQKSDISIDIFVIDNGSVDRTCEIIKKEYSQINLIISKKNLGFGGANNIGFELALKSGAEFFFLLNQDGSVESDTVRRLSEQIQIKPEYGLLSPLHLSGDGKKLDWHFISSASYSKCPGLTDDFVLGLDTDKIYETQNVCAAAWLISKKCLKKVGGFSPSFFHYGEDNNYIQRMQYKSLKAGIYPRVKMYHDRYTRENDPKYNNLEFFSTNAYLIDIMNPSKNFNTKDLVRMLRIESIKSLLTGHPEDYRLKNKQIRTFRKYQSFNEKNLSISKSNNFPFLNFP